MRDLTTDNYPNDRTPFYILVGGAHCPKCLKAKKAIDALWQKGDLVGSRIFYVDGTHDRRMVIRTCVSSIPSLVRVRADKGIWSVDKATTEVGSQKKIMEYINADKASAESTEENNKGNTGE